MTELEDQVSDFRRCVLYLLYHVDLSEEAFGLLVEQMRPFGVRVIAYPRRDDLKHLEARGVIGFFMGPGDGPSMDRVYVKSTTKSTVRQYRHVVVVIYMHTMHAWLTVQMLWQMHGRTLQVVHMLIV